MWSLVKYIINNPKRFIAGARAILPALPFAISLMIGQIVFGLLDINDHAIYLFNLGIITAAILIWILGNSFLGLNLLIVALGLQLMVIAYPKPPKWLLNHSNLSHRAFIGKVHGDVRHRRVGQMDFNVIVSGIFAGGEKLSNQISIAEAKLSCSAIHLPWRELHKVKDGDIILFSGDIIPILSPPLISYNGSLLRKGVHGTCKILAGQVLKKSKPSKISELKYRIISKVRSILGDSERAGLLLSMSIGTRDVLTDRTELAFKRTGLAHLLVVSGYQVTLIFHLILTLFTILLSRFIPYIGTINLRWLPPSIGVIFGVLFAVFIGDEGATIRAGISGVLAFISLVSERETSFSNSLITSFIIMITIWPGCFLDPGVQLTYAALTGIALGLCRENVSKIWQFLLISTYASVLTSAVSVLWFQQFSFIGFILNPIAGALLGALACYGALLGIISAISTIDNHGIIIKFVGDILYNIRDYIRWLSELPFAYTEIPPNMCWLVAVILSLPVIFKILNELFVAVIFNRKIQWQKYEEFNI